MRFIRFLSLTVLLGAVPFISVPPEAQAGPAGTGLRAQRMILAGDQPITAGGFRFRIVGVAFDTTATGFVPKDMGPADRLMFVEFELLSGNRDDFKGLPLVLDSGPGRRSKAAVLFSGGMMKALTPLTIKSASYGYRPENSNVAWAFVVRETEAEYFLVFPTGPTISLAPLIKKDRAETAPTGRRDGPVRPELDRAV